MLIDYGSELEGAITALCDCIETYTSLSHTYDVRWLAITLLEGDNHLEEKVSSVEGGGAVLAKLKAISAELVDAYGEDVDTQIADRRYQFIAGLVRECVTRPDSSHYTTSDRIDEVVTHPVFGLPIFLVLMWFVFQMTANVSGVFLDWIDGVINGPFARWAVALMELVGLGDTWFASLLVDGVIAGVGGVLVFVPVLAFLYFFIALLEDSGYMARAAFVMDRFMRVLGLHGKSFIPLLVGFGCSVPGIYATRTLEDDRDRILTALMVPFMSCAARLPVYVLIGTAFFGENSGNLVFAMYLLGVGIAVLTGLMLRRTAFRKTEHTPFVMEMPPFRRPSMNTIWAQVRDRTVGFVEGVWTVILAASVVVWLLLNVPYENGRPPALEDSLFSDVSRTIAPVFHPAGYGTWEASGSLITGMLAKEVVVSTMSQVYNVADADDATDEANSPTILQDVGNIVEGFGQAIIDTAKAMISLIPGINLTGNDNATDDSALQAALRENFTALQAVAFAVFVLLYTPCMATVGAIRQELGTRWMWFSVVYQLVIAWGAAVIVYQVGLFWGWG